MKKIDLEQNSDEWHAFRKRHIGGSDAASVMRLSPYKSYEQLYAEKTGAKQERIFESDAARRGKELEPVALGHFNDRYDLNCKPAVFESTMYPFISASMDGWDSVENVAVEIKVPFFDENHERNCRTLLPHYNAQLQHQMFVLELDSIFFLSYFVGLATSDVKIFCRKVERDEKFIQELVEAESKFWNNLRSHKTVEQVMYDDFAPMNDEWDDVAKAAWEVKQKKRELLLQVKDCEGEYDSLCETLTDLSDYKNSVSKNFELKETQRAGKIQYSEIPELKEVDLEQYRDSPKHRFILKKRKTL